MGRSRKYTDEELEEEFEAAWQEVLEDKDRAVRYISKTVTVIITILIFFLSIALIIVGAYFGVSALVKFISLTLDTGDYIVNAFILLLSIVFVIEGLNIQDTYLWRLS